MASDARVLDEPVTTTGELDEALRGRDIPRPYSVAVEALLFDDGEWVLLERGPACRDQIGKLEGIGGGVEADDDGDLRAALRRELREEVGADADIEVAGFFEVRTDTVEPMAAGVDERHWVVVSHVCRLRDGELQVTEPAKNEGFHRVDPATVDPDRLSSSARSALESLRAERDRVERLLAE